MRKNEGYVHLPVDDIPKELLDMVKVLGNNDLPFPERLQMASKLVTCSLLIDNSLWKFEDDYLPILEKNQKFMRMLRATTI